MISNDELARLVLSSRVVHARHVRSFGSWRSIVIPGAVEAGSLETRVLLLSIVKYAPEGASWRHNKMRPRWQVSSGHTFASEAEANAESDRLVEAAGWLLSEIPNENDRYRDWLPQASTFRMM